MGTRDCSLYRFGTHLFHIFQSDHLCSSLSPFFNPCALIIMSWAVLIFMNSIWHLYSGMHSLISTVNFMSVFDRLVFVWGLLLAALQIWTSWMVQSLVIFSWVCTKPLWSSSIAGRVVLHDLMLHSWLWCICLLLFLDISLVSFHMMYLNFFFPSWKMPFSSSHE